jgi:hypothetical protein
MLPSGAEPQRQLAVEGCICDPARAQSETLRAEFALPLTGALAVPVGMMLHPLPPASDGRGSRSASEASCAAVGCAQRLSTANSDRREGRDAKTGRTAVSSL